MVVFPTAKPEQWVSACASRPTNVAIVTVSGPDGTRPAGSDWQLETISISYAANGLLHEADREEFKARLEPFAGLAPPAPLET
jgi:hypothetical protein